MNDDIDPELEAEVNEALHHGLFDYRLEKCREQPPHIHIAEMQTSQLPDPPKGVVELGLVVIGTVPELPDEDTDEARAHFVAPCTRLLDLAMEAAKEWKENAVNLANGPVDLAPVMRVSWPTFQTSFELGEYTDALDLDDHGMVIGIIHEAMVRPFGIPIGIEMVMDSWLYVPPDDVTELDCPPSEAYHRGLPGAFEAMCVVIATPLGSIQRLTPYRYGGGNVEWLPIPDKARSEWIPWDGSGEVTAGGRSVNALQAFFGPSRVRAKYRARGRIHGTTE